MAFVFLFLGFNFCYGIFFHFCCFVFEVLSCLFLVAGPQFCVSILCVCVCVSLSLLFLDENCVVGWWLRDSLRLL
jgi:hypothetical protein